MDQERRLAELEAQISTLSAFRTGGSGQDTCTASALIDSMAIRYE